MKKVVLALALILSLAVAVPAIAAPNWKTHGSTVERYHKPTSRWATPEVTSSWRSVRGIRVLVKKGSNGKLNAHARYKCNGFSKWHYKSLAYDNAVGGAYYTMTLRQPNAGTSTKSYCEVEADANGRYSTTTLVIQYE